MPNNKNRDGTVYIPTGNPETVNYTPNYAAGELGTDYSYNQKHYQIVQCDSGATVSTPTGIVATNMLAFWKDRTNYIVTNDRRFAEGGNATQSYQNKVAGRFGNAVTAGNICHITQRGIANLLDGGNTFAVGESVIAENDLVAGADRIAVGTAVTFQRLGFARGAAAAGVVSVDLDIPSVE
jgi:hypothetical protein